MYVPMPTIPKVHQQQDRTIPIINNYNQPFQHYQQQPQFEHFDQIGSINQPPPPLSSDLEPTSTIQSGQQQQPPTSTAKQPLNQQYQSTYQSFADIADPVQNPHLFIHVASGQKISRPWQAYISDLDDFFERIYRYYRKSGFQCILAENIFELLEILLVIFFTFLFVNFVDYEILFKRKFPPGHGGGSGEQDKTPLKITISDCFIPWSEVTFSSWHVILLIFAATFWFIKLGISIHCIVSNYAIRSFYSEALQIHDPSRYSWQEIQIRLINAQSYCLLRESHLDELAIHNRLLRRANYMIALVNKGVLPIYYCFPIIGDCIYLTSGLEFNLNILLFRGVFSLFDKNWKLRDEIKSHSERIECARRFANRCVVIGLINLLLFPLILIWQLLYAFYTYVEVAKREPTMFSTRTWSRYGRWFCRHFNELDHELEQRLNRAHRPATRYMNSFIDPLSEIAARFVSFIAGLLLSVLFVLTVYDEDVITVEHVLTLMTGLGVGIAIARAFLPDNEPNRWNFKELDAAILQNIHYRPHNHPAHTIQARTAMGNIFVYKFRTIVEELFSPLITPYILIRHLRPRSLEIIDFFRLYTLELTDIGDVCTFSQFNFHQNGHRFFNQETPPPPAQQQHSPTTKAFAPEIQPTTTTEPKLIPNLTDDQNATRNGKLELSLINFKLMNPKWQPHDNSQIKFIDHFMKQSCGGGNPKSIIPETEDDGPLLIMNQPNMAESKSTIDNGPSLTSSQMFSPTTATGAETSQKNQTSQSMSESSMLLGRDFNGFGETRRRLLQLRYGSILSEQEERDQEMALSSLYFYEILSDSVQQQQMNQSIARQQQATSSSQIRNESSVGDGPRSFSSTSSSTNIGHQISLNESIPLLKSKNETFMKKRDNIHDNDDFDD